MWTARQLTVSGRRLRAAVGECSELPSLWQEFQSLLDAFGNDKEKLLQPRDGHLQALKTGCQGATVTQ